MLFQAMDKNIVINAKAMEQFKEKEVNGYIDLEKN